ncbi:hypothetical protein MIZ01_1170 [Sideroxyarcus emersonii]|uniref:TIR domain-containing protein n=1 Tax=Sideroxyarcus emersonii TaxID=2764705 RepID=A0AAN1XA59_9PROT|nr:toll/interleukin-1 receptor domain-containing protein [Sideroxyarcus emersonii]BCK87392.1 hypothetical protein MIZ01_1170 [Sideroxyarcus emersonii]
MTDVFISYSTKDSQIAQQIHTSLSLAGVKTFMAELSIDPGAKWSEEIIKNMRSSQWVLFLASKAAIKSPAVQQEVGAAIFSGKTVIPVIWEISPEELPAWAKEQQAVDMRNGNIESLQPIFHKIAQTVRSNDFMAGVVVAALFFGFLYLITKK